MVRTRAGTDRIMGRGIVQKDKEEGKTNQRDKASLDMGSSKAPGCGATHDQDTVLRSSDDRLPHLYQKNARNLGARAAKPDPPRPQCPHPRGRGKRQS